MQHLGPSRPISLVNIAALADIALLEQWETHLLPLEHNGLIEVWSRRHLRAGFDRQEQTATHLDLADSVVLLLSADFFADDDCLTWMHAALQRQQKNAPVLIPLLLRPHGWQNSPLGSLPCLPVNGKPIDLWPNRDEAWHHCVQALRTLLGQPDQQGMTGRTSLRFGPGRERIVRRLRASYRDSLALQSRLVDKIALRFVEKPDAVQNVTSVLALWTRKRTTLPLPADTTITQVYNEATEELLILGEPGAGKSTLLLHLAEHLLDQAEHDERCPLPFLLPLSSWAVSKHARLEDWIREQIALQAGISPEECHQWLAQGRILVLLDGLDEVKESLHPVYIIAINVYHRTYGRPPLVITSRTQAYESAADTHHLELQRAIEIQPLTSTQIEKVLDQAGGKMANLRTMLQEECVLQTLMTTPLMVETLFAAYQEITIARPTKGANLEHTFWAYYAQRATEHEQKGSARAGSPEQRQTWLGQLARHMRCQGQQIFYLERLQANWLPERSQQALTWCATWLLPALMGIPVALFAHYFFSQTDIAIDIPNPGDPRFLFQIGLLGAFLAGWLRSPSRTKSAPFLLAQVGSSAVLGVLFGASFLNMKGIIFGISVGFSGFVLSRVLPRISYCSVSSSTNAERLRLFRFPWLRKIYVYQFVTIALVWGIAFGIGNALNAGTSCGLGPGWNGGLSYGLSFGVTGVLLSIIREHEDRIYRLVEHLHRDMGCLFHPRHLCESGLVAICAFLLFGVSDTLSDGISGGWHAGWTCGLTTGIGYGLSLGLIYWAIAGLAHAVVPQQTEDAHCRRFNQRLRRSLFIGFCAGFLIAVIILGISIPTFGLTHILYGVLNPGPSTLSDQAARCQHTTDLWTYTLSYMQSFGWLQTILSVLLIWSLVGGLAILRHQIIRLLLVRLPDFPQLDQASFDDATARILLTCHGGGYSFIHPHLCDYVADTYLPTARTTTERMESTGPLP
jgi:energy-coupling factor transporter ATP-binding protein EcfA2